jgi:Ca2+/H+ antiporter, TMEM165/GDT1 family
VEETFGRECIRLADPSRFPGPDGTEGDPLSWSYVAVAAAVFVITFLAELPDKSMFASLVLGTKYRPFLVWAGAAAAYAVHVAIDVTAGRVLANLLPRRVLAAVAAGLFAAGAVYLLASSFRTGHRDGKGADRQDRHPLSSLRVAGISFAVVFLAEWGDSPRLRPRTSAPGTAAR